MDALSKSFATELFLQLSFSCYNLGDSVPQSCYSIFGTHSTTKAGMKLHISGLNLQGSWDYSITRLLSVGTVLGIGFWGTPIIFYSPFLAIFQSVLKTIIHIVGL